MSRLYTTEALQEVVGKKYGMLTIINTRKDSKLGTVCQVICSCGNSKEYRLSVVLNSGAISCGCKSSQNLPKVGDRFINKRGNWCEVIEPKKWNDIIVRFDNTGTIKSFQADSLKRKIFYDPYEKTYWGFGYMGEGPYSGKSNKSAFNTWMHMIERCYDVDSKPYNLYGGSGVTVCDEWGNFQIFAQWFEEHKVDGWHMDKDFKNIGSVQYSPSNCLFLPPEINSLFTGYARGLKLAGTSKNKQGKWCSSTREDGKQISLGISDNWVEAKVKYLERKRKNAIKALRKYPTLDKCVANTIFEMTSIWYYLD